MTSQGVLRLANLEAILGNFERERLSEIDEESFIIFHQNPRIHFFVKIQLLDVPKWKPTTKLLTACSMCLRCEWNTVTKLSLTKALKKTKALKYKPRAHHSSVDCVLETRALIPIKLSILSEFLYFADSTFCLWICQ